MIKLYTCNDGLELNRRGNVFYAWLPDSPLHKSLIEDGLNVNEIYIHESDITQYTPIKYVYEVAEKVDIKFKEEI